MHMYVIVMYVQNKATLTFGCTQDLNPGLPLESSVSSNHPPPPEHLQKWCYRGNNSVILKSKGQRTRQPYLTCWEWQWTVQKTCESRIGSERLHKLYLYLHGKPWHAYWATLVTLMYTAASAVWSEFTTLKWGHIAAAWARAWEQ